MESKALEKSIYATSAERPALREVTSYGWIPIDWRVCCGWLGKHAGEMQQWSYLENDCEYAIFNGGLHQLRHDRC